MALKLNFFLYKNIVTFYSEIKPAIFSLLSVFSNNMVLANTIEHARFR